MSGNILCERNKKNRLCILVCIVLLTLNMGGLAGCSASGEKSETREIIPSDSEFAQISGIWQIDFDRTDAALWGSGVSSYGNSMEISETGAFSYYIGVGVGGTGQCEEKDGVITVEVEPYESHSSEQEILTLKYENTNGMEFIMMDWYDENVYWVRNVQTPIIFLTEYTGYLDEYVNWDGRESFTGCDYDADGLTDRVYREEIAVDEHSYNHIVNWRIEFGNGERIELSQYIEDFLSINAADLTGNGVPEIIVSGCNGASTDPTGYGVAAVFTRTDNGYESMPLPFPDSGEYGNGKAHVTPCIRLQYEVNNDQVKITSQVPSMEYTIELDDNIRSDLSSFGYEEGIGSVENTTYPYEVKIISDANNSRCMEFYFEAFWKWSMYRIVVTVGYHHGEFEVDHYEIVQA